jgi:hypothetical protein
LLKLQPISGSLSGICSLERKENSNQETTSVSVTNSYLYLVLIYEKEMTHSFPQLHAMLPNITVSGQYCWLIYRKSQVQSAFQRLAVLIDVSVLRLHNLQHTAFLHFL